MNILIIDSACDMEMVIAQANGRIADKTRRTSQSHSISLFQAIDAALADVGVTIRDIQLLCAGIGPGSFTGIRIALSSVRMLAQVLDIPALGINTQLLYAASADARDYENIIVAFDAKKGRVFGARYQKHPDSTVPRQMIAPGDYPISELLGGIQAGHRTLCIGDGAQRYASVIETTIDQAVIQPAIPSGAHICACALALFEKADAEKLDFRALLPFYARKSDAEIIALNKDRQSG